MTGLHTGRGYPMREATLPRDAPLYLEPVVAWRVWELELRLEHRGPLLRSITYRTIWPPRRVFHAHCLAQFRQSLKNVPAGVVRHECPNANHRCGVYALRECDDACRWARTLLHLVGQVKLWGRIYCYELGYIAEYAYPVSILYPGGELSVEIAERLSQSYGIEVIWR